MATELAVRNEGSLDELQRTATLLVASGYFDAKGDRNTQVAQLATKIMAGRELGYGPFASVQGIHVIQGRPQISANLMAAAVKNHPKYDYKVRKMEDTEVAIEFFEGSESLGVSRFTIEDARRAKTQNLDKFARNMLFARALSNGVRWYCPDVFYGNSVYVEGEIEDTGDDTPPAVVVVDRATGEIVEGEYTQVPPTNGNGNGHKTEPPAEDAPKDDGVAPWAENPDMVLMNGYTFKNMAEALGWGMAIGVFDDHNHARNAYDKAKRENPPADAQAMWDTWINEVARRVNEKDPNPEPVTA